MWEFSYLSKVDMDISDEELDRSDLMIVENFKRITEFYNREKTFKVCDNEIMKDILGFFVERDLMFEATLLTEIYTQCLKNCLYQS